MQRYETIYIIDPDVTEADRQALQARYAAVGEASGGYIVGFDEWGQKKLAYEIKKKIRGFYVRMDYCAQGAQVRELERLMRIDDRILRYLTIQLETGIEVNALKERLAAEEAERERKRAEKEAQLRAVAEEAMGAARDQEGDSDEDEDDADDESMNEEA
ncbi:MAG: 30S ribosomal protein S6 [Thermodesulfobacteriota bacterium]